MSFNIFLKNFHSISIWNSTYLKKQLNKHSTIILSENSVVVASLTEVLYVVNFPFVDPQGRPTITAISDHYVCKCWPYVLTFQKSSKTNKYSGLAEWIMSCFHYISREISVQIAFLKLRANFVHLSPFGTFFLLFLSRFWL